MLILLKQMFGMASFELIRTVRRGRLGGLRQAICGGVADRVCLEEFSLATDLY